MKEYSKKKQQAIRTKEKIYNSAISLIKEENYDDVKISDICKLAKVSVGSFYHHFDTKDDIIKRIIDEIDIAARENFIDEPNEPLFNSIKRLLLVESKIIESYGLKIVTQIAINQLKYGYEYFFNKKWFLEEKLVELLQNHLGSNDIIGNYSTQDISDIVLRTYRGIVIEWCIKRGSLSLYDLVNDHLETQYINFK